MLGLLLVFFVVVVVVVDFVIAVGGRVVWGRGVPPVPSLQGGSPCVFLHHYCQDASIGAMRSRCVCVSAGSVFRLPRLCTGATWLSIPSKEMV